MQIHYNQQHHQQDHQQHQLAHQQHQASTSGSSNNSIGTSLRHSENAHTNTMATITKVQQPTPVQHPLHHLHLQPQQPNHVIEHQQDTSHQQQTAKVTVVPKQERIKCCVVCQQVIHLDVESWKYPHESYTETTCTQLDEMIFEVSRQ